MNRKVLIVELDLDIVSTIRNVLYAEGIKTKAVYDIDSAALKTGAGDYDLLFFSARLLLKNRDRLKPLLDRYAIEKRLILIVDELLSDSEKKDIEIFSALPLYLCAPVRENELGKIIAQMPSGTKDDANETFAGMIGTSAPMQALYDSIRAVAPTEATVLITGETGTGKELVAHALHSISSRRFKKFVTIDCATLSKSLLLSELFGHKKGAFTGAIGDKTGRFAYADGGTPFLDEIGEISPETQSAILKVIETGKFHMLGGNEEISTDVRLIFATNRDLTKEVSIGNFRSDLYYRLNIFPIKTVPLRDRSEDIPALVNHFIIKYAERHNKKCDAVSKSALSQLLLASWPGNVRELERTIERAVILTTGTTISRSVLAINGSTQKYQPKENLTGIGYKEMKKRALLSAEKIYFDWLFKEADGNLSRAARIAGIDRKSLYNRLKACGFDRSDISHD